MNSPLVAKMKKNNKNTSAQWGKSLKYLSWDKNNTLDSTEMLISDTVVKWYDEKHKKTSNKEVEFINSINIEYCPFCGCDDFVKNGYYKSGYRQYKCNNCHKRFSPITNTIFDGKKIPISEWIEYLIHLFEFHSITTSSRDNRNASSTGKYWLIKVFTVLENIQDDVTLDGNIYFDEMFFPVVKSKEVLKDGKKLRGISRNKIAVAVAFDNHNHLLIKVENTSKPSNKSTWNALGKHIKKGSHLIHDGEKSHNKLTRDLKLTEEVYKSESTKKLDDKDNPLEPINKIHKLSKRFMKEHGGYNRDDLQDWMNLIWLILSKPDNRYEKIKKFLNIAIHTSKKVKFRDVMLKKR